MRFNRGKDEMGHVEEGRKMKRREGGRVERGKGGGPDLPLVIYSLTSQSVSRF